MFLNLLVQLLEVFKRNFVNVSHNGVFILIIGHFIDENSFTFVSPESDQEDFGLHVSDLTAGGDDLSLGSKDSFEDSGKFSHVEDVVELGGGGEHGVFNFIPQFDGGFGQVVDDLLRFFIEVFGLEGVHDDGGVDGSDVEGQNHVEDEALSFHSVGNVVSSSSGVVHGSDVLQILDVFELSNRCLFQHVESSLFDELSHNFECDLVSPHVHERHGHIIDENSHLFVVRGREVFSDFEVAFGLDCLLEHEGGCGG